MTCIVGMVKDGVTYIGGDSFGSNGYTGQTYENKKVFHVEGKKDVLAGYTSSFRMGQLLQYSTGLIDELSYIKNVIDERYLVNNFVPKLQELFKDGKFGKEGEGGVFLFGIKGRLYIVQGDFSLLEPSDGYCACGCGEDFAMAVLHALRDIDMTPQEKIKLALESASKFSVGVNAPYFIVDSESMETKEL